MYRVVGSIKTSTRCVSRRPSREKLNATKGRIIYFILLWGVLGKRPLGSNNSSFHVHVCLLHIQLYQKSFFPSCSLARAAGTPEHEPLTAESKSAWEKPGRNRSWAAKTSKTMVNDRTSAARHIGAYTKLQRIIRGSLDTLERPAKPISIGPPFYLG